MIRMRNEGEKYLDKVRLKTDEKIYANKNRNYFFYKYS
jgi:hypothetical protein